MSIDQESGTWELAEIVSTTSQSTRDFNHANESETANLHDLGQGFNFGDELHYSDNDLDELFNNIACLQSDDIQTNVPLLDDIGDIAASQSAPTDARSAFMAFDNVLPSPSSSSQENPDTSASGDCVPTLSGGAGFGMDPPSCQCRKSILRILAEIESVILSANPSNMYATMSYHRQTMAASKDILTSRICNCSMTFFGLLEIIGEKLTRLSEAIITAFVCHVKEQNASVDSGQSISPGKSHDRKTAMRLGEYQVQTLQELKVISAAVIRLQLKQSMIFVSRIRELAMSMNHLAQAQSLKKLEDRLNELIVKIQRMASDVESDFCDA